MLLLSPSNYETLPHEAAFTGSALYADQPINESQDITWEETVSERRSLGGRVGRGGEMGGAEAGW